MYFLQGEGGGNHTVRNARPFRSHLFFDQSSAIPPSSLKNKQSGLSFWVLTPSFWVLHRRAAPIHPCQSAQVSPSAGGFVLADRPPLPFHDTCPSLSPRAFLLGRSVRADLLCRSAAPPSASGFIRAGQPPSFPARPARAFLPGRSVRADLLCRSAVPLSASVFVCADQPPRPSLSARPSRAFLSARPACAELLCRSAAPSFAGVFVRADQSLLRARSFRTFLPRTICLC